MTKTVRLTMAQALTRFLSRQMTEIDGRRVPIFGGVWAIFGHGNVAGIGEALYQVRDELPTFRAHNEQAMAHAAIGYAKANFRRRFMATTTSIGPGALNMVTAAALAHVNRLPVLLLPGDVFANRLPDPVLQQAEDFSDGTASVNDCFRPVSRYFDRITRPEQIVPALNRAMQVLTDPAECGPVTLSLCQDVQAEAYDYPESLFAERVWTPRRVRPDRHELANAVAALKGAKKPLVIAGGGVLYSQASGELAKLVQGAGIPVCETQGGKSSLSDDHPLNMAAVGVTGTSAANRLAEEADVVLAVGTRLQDFTTGSWALFKNAGRTIVGLNTQGFDAGKHWALPLVADAAEGLAELSAALKGWKAPTAWTDNALKGKKDWQAAAAKVTASTNAAYPSDAQVIGAVQRAMGSGVTLLHAAGGLPGELHKLWQAGAPGSYHAEYGFSTMGYEIAGGLGVKMARPDQEVVVMVGDGSYLMLNSEIATSVMLGLKLTIVLLDNRGYGCINRLQMATGGANFNNLLKDARHEVMPDVDFAAHAASLGAVAEKVASIAELETALAKAKQNSKTTVLVIDTDPLVSTEAGGHWWDVAVPEVSSRAQVNAARKAYEGKKQMQSIGD
ncbi:MULTISPECIES: 3D-(3,5/4)-trihydroxycyclohexane-1,2-dione acylhydrolase (decyclizing) [unclassified Mesorhizobium]|uniref:3D-(3,5/4)-trihydroxycyclohexane-1,2-dione acylhydrolase (decyclizing) n=1 Tax=unclassified Mesorhizobium TaxID=325217 RepID=UPI000FCA2FDB|nr:MULTISPECIES: 3D-(3,5/4)-trihydroxycyclohexane-1,2-dione acylhydrolase (decyclizing) [unclassified Mesorhizobium]RUW34990.1 3D-(3,5/4)-trihydroxycyclohexane-1,2-dione acylhydrolase (decyclizing) [Mesorhizobium sp. M1E.F.Ca.ET.041.01.1.1]RWD87522.1 MAG: 3D-(3,5/4)-trihydroxycyclohexane-1,2-dione acylhydrolase (decyclizing) [Mesorhizobium sp.]RWD91544.1 MAG: 3D-(3,5/4)-trihydroxycyclohexane-1,2-dione acylhydrolase (decyclizing) [Mesorhizobium sp.]TIV49270.1 MAG: 3D-(3,5/4)-trihydroxycyclohexan